MTFLLPQFKSPPSQLHINIHSHTSKSRQPVCFQIRCLLPMTNTMTTATVDMEKLPLPCFNSHIDSIAAERPLMYAETIGTALKENLESTFAKETNLPSEEAVIAAAEAVALAKEAAQVANEVALMFGSKPFERTMIKTSDVQSGTDINKLQGAQLTDMHLVGTVGLPYSGIGHKTEGEQAVEFSRKDSDSLDPMNDELKLLQMQLSETIAVRSQRQSERKARRARGAKKASVNAVSANSESSSRKKRSSVQEVDHSDPLRYLRATTNTSRLLTATEEKELSEGIQDLLKLESLNGNLAERYGCEPTIAQWAAAAGVDTRTLRKRLNYGILCKDKMIKSNIRLVISIAKNYLGAGMNLQDLVQEGCRGLVRGAEKFDASKGFKFSTYAHWWIKQAVRKSLSDQSRTIRLPFHMVEATYRVKEARKQLYNENGRHPDDKEIAEATGLSMKRLSSVLLAPKTPRSFDQKIGINQSLKPSEIIADPEAETTEDILTKQFMKQDLQEVLGSLNPREKQVVQWRFGLEDGRMKTLQEIGELMGVSRERVRQIESCAFRKLKNKKRTKNLQQYLVSQAL